MLGCVEFPSRMTGSTGSGPPQTPKDFTPSLPFPLPPAARSPSGGQHQIRVKMTPVPPSGQPIQLTPLWEHVVRTRRLPSSVDTVSTFHEIAERLRDPEWEVRQHALRVLVDVLPALEQNVVDRAMVPVLPELVSNLGHPAPAVRKGALDTLRVYLCYSQDKETMFKDILDAGLNRPDALDNFQTNVTMGVILSVPSLLFPSASSPRPPSHILKYTVMALAARLVQVTHQEVALRSLLRIREIIGAQEFDSYMLDYNANVKRDFDVLCDVYNIKVYGDSDDKKDIRRDDEEHDIISLGQVWGIDSDTSGETEDGKEDGDQEDISMGTMPPARVVLETEIKFDEETAITMTILEEKDDETEGDDSDDESESDENDVGVVQVLEDITERRKTPKRVHFGGEVIKLRTPDSDETDVEKLAAPKTRIPLPVSPATRMPLDRRRASSQPSSPSHSKCLKKDGFRSQSSSPRRDIHTYNADLSPKKGILSRTNSPVFIIQPIKTRRSRRRRSPNQNSNSANNILNESNQLKQIKKNEETEDSSTGSSDTKENDAGMFNIQVNGETSFVVECVIPDVKKEESSMVKRAPDQKEFASNVSQQTSRDPESNEAREIAPKTVDGKTTPRGSPKRSSRPSSRATFEVFPKQERNYILMELSSPVRKKFDARERDTESPETTTFSPFGSTVSDTPSNANPRTPTEANVSKETPMSNQLFNQIIDTVSIETVGVSQSAMAQVFDTSTKPYQQTSSKGVHNVQLSNESNSSQGVIATGTYSTDQIGNQIVGGAPVPSSTDDERANNGCSPAEAVFGKNQSFRKFPIDETVTTMDGSESLTCSSSEGEGQVREPSWEELGLVDPETLNDLHNKDDWRARVRGLERVASALRTSSSLVAIEPRLGSLLHAVLGGERSCRASAAGLTVARVVVAGVSEDALRRRLFQLAWGLARQGGPHAAQLARIAMLRLKPALLLEQLLQPHCISARNAKTRENALQLLIFSLVTFPSTEFRVETVASRVAGMVGDRRRRVRQAALDTLAVLAQIYEPEEVLEAGAQAARGRHDGDAMMSAIRARLSRKSLPLVSADGLVVYGLQISPTLQIATGADVDWIVAGSGSVSPGSGRSRGQLIATTGRLDSGNILRNESANNGRNPWTDRPEFLAVGIGVGPRDQQPVGWKLIPVHNQDDHRSRGQGWASDDRNANAGISNGKGSDHRLKLEEKFRKYCTTSDRIHDPINKRESRDTGEGPNGVTANQQKANEFLHKQFQEFCREKIRMRSPPPQEGVGSKLESRIPVLHARDSGPQMKETSGGNVLRRGNRMEEPGRDGRMSINVIQRRVTQDSTTGSEGSSYRLDPRDDNIGYGTMYQRRRRLIEGNTFQGLQPPPNGPNYPYHPRFAHHILTRKAPEHMDRDIRTRADVGRDAVSQGIPEREQLLSEMPTSSYPGVPSTRILVHSPDKRRRRSRSRSEEHHYDFINKTAPSTPQTPPVRDTYGTMYQRRRRLIEGNAFRALQTPPNGTNHYSYHSRYSHHTPPRKITEQIDNEIRTRVDVGRDALSQGVPEREQLLLEMPTSSYPGVPSTRGSSRSPDRRRRRSRSRSELHHHDSSTTVTPATPQTPPMRDTDKAAVDVEQYNEEERLQAQSQTTVYQIQNFSSESSQFQGDERSNSVDSSTSNISVDDSQQGSKQQTTLERRVAENSPASNSRSSSPHSQNTNSTINAIPLPSGSKRRDSIDSYVISVTTDDVNNPVGSIALEIADTDTSSEDELTEKTDVQFDQDKLSHDNANVENAQNDGDETLEVILTCQEPINEESIHSVTRSDESFFSDHLLKYSRESLRSNHSSNSKQSFRSNHSSKSKESNRSHHSSKSKQSLRSNHSSKHSDETRSVASSRQTLDEKKSLDSIFSNHSNKSVHTASLRSASEHENMSSQRSLEIFTQDGADDLADDDEERMLSSVLPDDSSSVQSVESRGYFKEVSTSNSVTVIKSSRPHSEESFNFENLAQNNSSTTNVSFENIRISPKQSDTKVSSEEKPPARDVTSSQSINFVSPKKSSVSVESEASAGVDSVEVEVRPPSPFEPSEQPRRPSRVPRSKTKPRVNSIRSPPAPPTHVDKPPEKPKVMAQLCFTQLESKDWEVTVKGLKALSQVARHHPEQLEIWGPGTLGRLIGKHVRNLRSQVSRAACLAAGDVFSSQIKVIEQELDDIAGPLLHRTADTNRFLRADSNAALDRMMERLPPHRTISVIVHRGATSTSARWQWGMTRILFVLSTLPSIPNNDGATSHQNAIVRAATARLLTEVVERIGPEQAMTMPREVRDKLLVTGAKLLIDGNLDARNHAKKMFRGLTRCEGFQKTLTDAVPETTLRHIDKTLKSL